MEIRIQFFFHLTTLKHIANNRIASIKKGQDLLTKENDISAEAVSFFSYLLSWDPLLSKVDQEDIVACITQIIQPHHNKMPQAIPSTIEVREALFSFPTDKSPSPNGSYLLFPNVLAGGDG